MVNILTHQMIRDMLQKLTKMQLSQLKCAFEQDIAQYIVLDGDIFVGVNVEPLTNLEIQDSQGVWACGKVIR